MRNLPVLVCLAMVAAACNNSGPVNQTEQITKTQTVKETTAAPAKLPTSADRFGAEHAHGAPGPAGPMAGGMGSGGAVALEWSKPEGWDEAPASAMRQANFKVTGHPEAGCYLSVAGGGAEANVNRWRKQMSQPDYSADEFAKLQRKTVLGQQAVLVEIDGAFVGMGGSEKKDGYKLLGAIVDYEGKGVFVKMTGPASVVEGEKAHFAAFVDSLKPGAAKPATQTADPGALPPDHPGALPAGHPGVDAGGMADGATAAPFTWTAPDTWKKGADRPMRVVTYTGGTSGKTECIVSLLSGAAGGVEANVNRWRGQMGQTPLPSADIAALPKIKILGKDSPIVEISGAYTGMDGGEQPGYMMIGAVAETPGNAIFIKMIGPEAEVKAEKEHFIAFCQSLK